MNNKVCNKCGNIMILREGSRGKFWGCSAFPKCKNTENYKYEQSPIVKVNVGEFTPSPQQEKIYQAFEVLDNHILITAGPGCGKTSTLVSGLKFLPKGKSILMLAFNKDIVRELESRIPETLNVLVKTLNSLGYGFVKTAYPKARYDAKKLKDIVKRCPMIPEDNRKQMTPVLINILSKLSSNMLDISKDNVVHVIKEYGIELEYDRQIEDILKWIYCENVKGLESSISFDDMLAYPARNPQICGKYDIIMVDEAQDLSKENLALIRNCMHTKTKVVFVGDPNQSIYAFRGANSDSIEQIKREFSPKILPLTITRRIPQTIVSFLNRQFPNIVLTSEKTGGLMCDIKDKQFVNEIIKDETAMVLCRFNAPLVKPCLSLIREGYKAIIRGKDIASDIVMLIATTRKKYESESISDLLENLEMYYNSMVEKYNSSKPEFLEMLDDKIKVIESVAEVCDTIDNIIEKLEEIFNDDVPTKYEFSSIHRAKGKESENVYCLNPNRWISTKAVTQNQKQQELNASWVGFSRSKNKMVFVHEG